MACFKDPITGPIEGKPVNPQPAIVKEDSVSVDAIDNDDAGGDPHHAFTLTSRAPFLDIHDTSVISIDTSSSTPILHMKLNLSPMYDDDSDAKEAKLKQVQIVLDSVPVSGDDWMWLNNGQVRFVVKVSEKPASRYGLVNIIQPRSAPYTKDDSYARLIMWKLTAKRVIVLHFEAQVNYSVQLRGGPSRDHQRVVGEVRLRY